LPEAFFMPVRGRTCSKGYHKIHKRSIKFDESKEYGNSYTLAELKFGVENSQAKEKNTVALAFLNFIGFNCLDSVN
jgi:hypothetical protein